MPSNYPFHIFLSISAIAASVSLTEAGERPEHLNWLYATMSGLKRRWRDKRGLCIT